MWWYLDSGTGTGGGGNWSRWQEGRGNKEGSDGEGEGPGGKRGRRRIGGRKEERRENGVDECIARLEQIE